MDEIITAERREKLKKDFLDVANQDILTNQDALMIIEILHGACMRKKAELYEDYISGRIEGDGEG